MTVPPKRPEFYFSFKRYSLLVEAGNHWHKIWGFGEPFNLCFSVFPKLFSEESLGSLLYGFFLS